MKYSFTGADNQTYGPVDITTLRQWAAEGRITPNTPLTDETGAHTVLASVLLSADALPPVTPQFVLSPYSAVQCAHCGQPSPSGTGFCPSCGAMLPPALLKTAPSKRLGWLFSGTGCLSGFGLVLLIGGIIIVVLALGAFLTCMQSMKNI